MSTTSGSILYSFLSDCFYRPFAMLNFLKSGFKRIRVSSQLRDNIKQVEGLSLTPLD